MSLSDWSTTNFLASYFVLFQKLKIFPTCCICIQRVRPPKIESGAERSEVQLLHLIQKGVEGKEWVWCACNQDGKLLVGWQHSPGPNLCPPLVLCSTLWGIHSSKINPCTPPLMGRPYMYALFPNVDNEYLDCICKETLIKWQIWQKYHIFCIGLPLHIRVYKFHANIN